MGNERLQAHSSEIEFRLQFYLFAYQSCCSPLFAPQQKSLERDPPCELGEVRAHCGFSLGRSGNALRPRVLFGEGVDRLRAELSEGLPED